MKKLAMVMLVVIACVCLMTGCGNTTEPEVETVSYEDQLMAEIERETEELVEDCWEVYEAEQVTLTDEQIDDACWETIKYVVNMVDVLGLDAANVVFEQSYGDTVSEDDYITMQETLLNGREAFSTVSVREN